MATTLTRNLKLRINSNLTADAKFNLERIDALGSTFLVDSADTLNIRSRSNISIEPDSADLGGNSTGGSLNIGNSSHLLESVAIYSDSTIVSSPLGLKDQAAGGNKHLLIQYKSDSLGNTDTSLDRTLSIDPQGANRSLQLEGDLYLSGGSFTFITAAGSSVTVPATGTLATLAGIETLTNKTINASQNTITNLTNSAIAAGAGIVYSKLLLTDSILNSDINSAAAIQYSKLSLNSSIVNSDIANSAAISRSKIASGTLNHVLINDGSGNLSSEEFLSKTRGGFGFNTSGLSFPVSGALVSTTSTQTLSNKTISGSSNTLSDIPYSSLLLNAQILDTDISASAAIQYSKLNLASSILDSDIGAGAAISRGKVAAGTANHIVINGASGELSSEAQLDIARGGTGASDQNTALNNLLPAQTGNANKFLQTDGTDSNWVVVSGSGTVTSVDLSAPSEFTVSGNPVTTSGTLTIQKATQAANWVWAGPSTGANAVPAFRALVAADIPTLSTTNVTEGTNLYFSDERAQDAVGTILTDSSSIDLTYDDGAGTITAAVIPSGIDHGSISGLSDDDHSQYHNDSRAVTWLGTRSTSDLPEGTGLYFTEERAQDAVGTSLTDSSSIDFTYNDGAGTITAAVLPGGVDHNSLLNYEANRHTDHSTVSIDTSSSSGLSGGGDITTTRNLVIDPTRATAATPASGDILLFADVNDSNSLKKATLQELLDIGIGGGKVTDTWETADGASLAITHSLNTLDISVTIYDIDSGADILVDSVVRTDVNTVTLTASEAPTGSGWRVLIRK